MSRSDSCIATAILQHTLRHTEAPKIDDARAERGGQAAEAMRATTGHWRRSDFFRNWPSGVDDEPWDAGLMVINLAGRLVAFRSTYSHPRTAVV